MKVSHKNGKLNLELSVDEARSLSSDLSDVDPARTENRALLQAVIDSLRNYVKVKIDPRYTTSRIWDQQAFDYHNSHLGAILWVEDRSSYDGRRAVTREEAYEAQKQGNRIWCYVKVG